MLTVRVRGPGDGGGRDVDVDGVEAGHSWAREETRLTSAVQRSWRIHRLATAGRQKVSGDTARRRHIRLPG